MGLSLQVSLVEADFLFPAFSLSLSFFACLISFFLFSSLEVFFYGVLPLRTITMTPSDDG
jgi:hypothetical protein